MERLLPGTLYVVATPIGNLEDLSPRAVQILRDAERIVAEDTRHSRKLLDHFDVRTRLTSLHEHSDDAVVEAVVDALVEGADIALISDAGTPLISDPGFELVRMARGRGLHVVPIPGPSAVTAALSVAGLPSDRFCFLGFPPRRGSARERWFSRLIQSGMTAVMFESARRVGALLAELRERVSADTEVFVARELTKRFEEHFSGSLEDVAAALEAAPLRGEAVIVLAPITASTPDDADLRPWIEALDGALPPSKAARVLAKATGKPRSECFDAIERLQSRKHKRTL